MPGTKKKNEFLLVEEVFFGGESLKKRKSVFLRIKEHQIKKKVHHQKENGFCTL